MADDNNNVSALMPVDGTPDFVEPQAVAQRNLQPQAPRTPDDAYFYRAGEPAYIAAPQAKEWADFKAAVQNQMAAAKTHGERGWIMENAKLRWLAHHPDSGSSDALRSGALGYPENKVPPDTSSSLWGRPEIQALKEVEKKYDRNNKLYDFLLRQGAPNIPQDKSFEPERVPDVPHVNMQSGGAVHRASGGDAEREERYRQGLDLLKLRMIPAAGTREVSGMPHPAREREELHRRGLDMLKQRYPGASRQLELRQRFPWAHADGGAVRRDVGGGTTSRSREHEEMYRRGLNLLKQRYREKDQSRFLQPITPAAAPPYFSAPPSKGRDRSILQHIFGEHANDVPLDRGQRKLSEHSPYDSFRTRWGDEQFQPSASALFPWGGALRGDPLSRRHYIGSRDGGRVRGYQDGGAPTAPNYTVGWDGPLGQVPAQDTPTGLSAENLAEIGKAGEGVARIPGAIYDQTKYFAQFPGDVAAGKYGIPNAMEQEGANPLSDEYYNRAGRMATSFVDSMPLVGAGTGMVPKGAAGIFGGRLAAENLEKAGWPQPKAAMGIADKMREAGASPEAIYAQTSKFLKDTPFAGVSRNAWGEHQFEMPDDAMTTAFPHEDWTTLGDDVHHPWLYKAYPQAENWPSRIGEADKEWGRFLPEKQSVEAYGPTSTERAGSAIHEITHGATQGLEGWPQGIGSPENATRAIMREEHPIASRIVPGFLSKPSAIDDLKGYARYQSDPSELQAQDARRRMFLTPEERRSLPPESAGTEAILRSMHDPGALERWQQGAPDTLFHGSVRELTELNPGSPMSHPIAVGGDMHLPTPYLSADPRFAKQFGENIYRVTGHDKSKLFPDPEVIPFSKRGIPNNYSSVIYTDRIPAVTKEPTSEPYNLKDFMSFALRNPRSAINIYRQAISSQNKADGGAVTLEPVDYDPFGDLTPSTLEWTSKIAPNGIDTTGWRPSTNIEDDRNRSAYYQPVYADTPARRMTYAATPYELQNINDEADVMAARMHNPRYAATQGQTTSQVLQAVQEAKALPDLSHIAGRNFDTMEDAQQAIRSANAEGAFEIKPIYSAKQTKFGQYTLPGGDNYREMLLTLPRDNSAREVAADRIKAIKDRTEQIQDEFNAIGKAPETPDLAAKRLALYNEKTALWSEWHQLHHIVTEPDTTSFKSAHWDEPNVLAHVRFDDRNIDGDKTLHMSEIQSDWHQAGRTRGYKIPVEPQPTGKWQVTQRNPDGSEVPYSAFDDEQTANEWAQRVRDAGREARVELEMTTPQQRVAAVPDAPFKTTWPDLALKRMIRYGAENGYDRISWDTGETNADRYDLSKHIDELLVNKNDDGTFGLIATMPNNQPSHPIGSRIPPEKLPDYVGKDLAEKIVKQDSKQDVYNANDLKVGGEGMKGFYDQILPSVANKLVKKYGAKVEQKNIPFAGPDKWLVQTREGQLIPFDSQEEAVAAATETRRGAQVVHSKAKGPVWSVPITPALRDAVLKNGFPLFNKGGRVSRANGGCVLVPVDYNPFSQRRADGGQTSFADAPVAKPGEIVPPQYGSIDPSQWPQTTADLAINALGPIGEAGMTVGDMLRTGNVDPRDVVSAAGNVLLGVGIGPGAPEERAGLAAAKVLDHGLIDRAKQFFGITFNPRESGYVLPDGTSLDFSGRHADQLTYQRVGQRNVPNPGQRDYMRDARNTDHRELGEIFPDELGTVGGGELMLRFMNNAGAVRNYPGIGFDTAVMPTDKQITKLVSSHNQTYRGEPMRVDITHPDTGETISSNEFKRPTVPAIKDWLQTNVVAQTDAVGNEGLDYLLGPKSTIDVIGEESGAVKNNGVSILKVKNAPEGYESSRLVYTKDGNIVGAMQVTKTPTGEPTAANTFVHPDFRRSGIATQLNSAAEQLYGGPLQRSEGPSPAGAAFRESIAQPSKSELQRAIDAKDWQKIIELQRERDGLRAAMRDPETGKIYTGWSHQQAIESVPKGDESGAWGRLHSEWDRATPNAGFVDANGNFISRDDAEKRWNILTMEDIRKPRRAAGGRIVASKIDHSPTEKQKEAGNYRKDRIHILGMAISVENAKGSVRRGKDVYGKEWRVRMPCAYGFFIGTRARDGDNVDAFIGPHIKSPHIFIIDQVDAKTKQYDEPKVGIGWATPKQFVNAYLKAFSDGKGQDRIGAFHEMSVDAFRDWLEHGDTHKPFAHPHKLPDRVQAILHRHASGTVH